MLETRTSTPRLRRITITCEHRGDRPEADAKMFAAILARLHGWTTACSLSSTCGCISLFRTSADMRAHLERLGIPSSALGAPASAQRPRLH